MYIYVLLAFTVLIVLWYQKRKNQMSLFRRLNIPGPEPHLITGNLKEFNEKGPMECQRQWTQKYGKILGYYIGARPILLVSDTELLKYVQVKNFQDFSDRPVFPADGGIPDYRIFHGISLMLGNRWKETRSMVSPGFSTNRMKPMTETINNATDILLDIIKEQIRNNESLDVAESFRSLTLDIIERIVFGIQANVQHDTSGIFQESIKRITENDLNKGVSALILCLPELESVIFVYRKAVEMVRSLLGLASIGFLLRRFKEIINHRRNQKIRRPDLLQILIDANLSVNQLKMVPTKGLFSNVETNDGLTTNEYKALPKPRPMTEDEVMGNAMTFILAGHDTTATTLSFILHLLVKYPEVQEKLRKEINDVLESEELDYSAINKMQYMQQVISETLRYYPIVLTFITRAVGKSFTYKNFTFPEGLTIQPAVWQMHRDPDLWENADSFDPDRFLPNRKSTINKYAHQSFGIGPRNCIGMRMAFTIMKLILAKLLHSYKFVMKGRSESELKVQLHSFLIKPVDDGSIYALTI